MQQIKLYSYQETAVQRATQMIVERGNSLIVAGTGAGKTIMLAAVIGRFFYGFQSTNGRKPHILVLAHRTEIHSQNRQKFTGVCPEIPTSEVTAEKKSFSGYVHFGMVQTVVGLLSELEKSGSFFDLIVIDECHHSAAATYNTIINWNRNNRAGACLFGVTATPSRGDELPLVHLFDNFNQITTKFLIDSHYLVRPTFIDCSPVFRVEQKRKGEVITVEEKGHLSKNCKMDIQGLELISKLCDEFLAKKADGKSILFAPSHDWCKVINDELSKRGRSPAYLSPSLDADMRRAEIARFEQGDADELINVDIATEGYDYPPIRNVVDFDTNGTHSQWVQKVGRGLRTCEGKFGCTVIDFGGNIELYPQGVETDVNLDGVTKNPKGIALTETDLFREKSDKSTAQYSEADDTKYTPYAPPKGFETVSDEVFGVVYVFCGEKRDCIVVKDFDSGFYKAFLGDKTTIHQALSGTFEECTGAGLEWCGEPAIDEQKTVSRLQTRLLAPEFSTAALTWYGANCCICWKIWRKTVSPLCGR